MPQDKTGNNSKPLVPKHYTTHEGGFWLDWTYGEVTEQQLGQRDSRSVEINSQVVHSLAFGDLGQDNFSRWDCINGWNRKWVKRAGE